MCQPRQPNYDPTCPVCQFKAQVALACVWVLGANVALLALGFAGVPVWKLGDLVNTPLGALGFVLAVGVAFAWAAWADNRARGREVAAIKARSADLLAECEKAVSSVTEGLTTMLGHRKDDE